MTTCSRPIYWRINLLKGYFWIYFVCRGVHIFCAHAWDPIYTYNYVYIHTHTWIHNYKGYDLLNNYVIIFILFLEPHLTMLRITSWLFAQGSRLAGLGEPCGILGNIGKWNQVPHPLFYLSSLCYYFQKFIPLSSPLLLLLLLLLRLWCLGLVLVLTHTPGCGVPWHRDSPGWCWDSYSRMWGSVGIERTASCLQLCLFTIKSHFWAQMCFFMSLFSL